jgi:hypothetical protein
MCDPATAIAATSLALGAGSAIASAKAQDKLAKTNAADAIRARNEDFRALGLQEQQTQDATQASIMTAHRTALNADAVARLSAGEAGVAGASVQAILGDISAQESEFTTQAQRNETATITQLQQEKRGAAAGAQSRINAVQPSNPLAVGLTIGAGALDFASNQIRLHTPPPAKG